MKSAREKISVLFVPEGEGESRSFRISRLTIRVFFISLAVFFVLLCAGMISYFIISVKASRYEQTVADNLRLIEENRRIIKLSEELRRLEAFNRQIRKALGVALELDSTYIDTGGVFTPQVDSWSMQVLPAMNQPIFQLPVNGLVSREYTTGVFPGQTHSGVDFAVAEGTLVTAAADGWVVFTGWHYRYGNLLIIQHSGAFLTFYGHNRSILVEIGEKVKRGQPVAVSGNSGRSTAPHLHFEIRRRGVAVNPYNLLSELARQPGDSTSIPPSEGD